MTDMPFFIRFDNAIGLIKTSISFVQVSAIGAVGKGGHDIIYIYHPRDMEERHVLQFNTEKNRDLCLEAIWKVVSNG